MVAQLRGVRFEACRSDPGVVVPVSHDLDKAFGALNDVAWWLGYTSQNKYNVACAERPDEVEERLQRAS